MAKATWASQLWAVLKESHGIFFVGPGVCSGLPRQTVITQPFVTGAQVSSQVREMGLILWQGVVKRRTRAMPAGVVTCHGLGPLSGGDYFLGSRQRSA